jgi:hypothetical protein
MYTPASLAASSTVLPLPMLTWLPLMVKLTTFIFWWFLEFFFWGAIPPLTVSPASSWGLFPL